MRKGILLAALLLFVISATIIFTSCGGADKAKIDKAKDLYTEVKDLKASAISSADAAALAEDDATRTSINGTDEKIAEFADVDFAKKTNDELDKIIADLETVKTTLNDAITAMGAEG